MYVWARTTWWVGISCRAMSNKLWPHREGAVIGGCPGYRTNFAFVHANRSSTGTPLPRRKPPPRDTSCVTNNNNNNNKCQVGPVTVAWSVLKLGRKTVSQISRLGANILNQQSQKATWNGHPACGVYKRPPTASRKNRHVTNVTALDLDSPKPPHKRKTHELWI